MIVLASAPAGGWVNGLTGFGTALAAVGLWLYALPPDAASMAVVCAAVAQLQTLLMIWRDIRWHAVLPPGAAGIFGVPIGTLLLRIQSRDRRLSHPLSG